ncbi:DNA gyrase subunit A [Candidatus Woesearchaeota archaeon]|nr:DNA gyrase subunit A [Candidatus Woesearchaeota archaeon]
MEEKGTKVIPQVIEEEMKQAYVDYAMSVIVGRALPDVRDGLKPVHRRILFAMQQMGMLHNKPYKKSARIVGEVLGKYHPHGDTAVYDTMVRMAQDFSLRYPLIDGQGNFGSIDGDRAAAMRYTEARLKKIAEEMLQDIEKETVNFQDNFDGSLKEPTVLPSKVPNLLINGSAGIAVGMATNVPPHNLKEVSEGAIALIDNPELSSLQLMEKIPGPDFPTGAHIVGKQGIVEAYTKGRGKVIVKGVSEVKDDRIIVTEIPYMVNKAMLIEQIADLVRDKKIEGIRNIRDESDREGIRIVIELKSGADSDVVLNQLYKYSRLRVTFGIYLLALVDNEPKLLTLKNMLNHYIKHRQTVVRKRTEFDLKKAEERAHVLEGLIVAINNIDEVIPGIRKSKTVEDAKNFLMSSYDLTEVQAKAILEMKLQKLASLEQEKTKKEHEDLLILVKSLKEVLADEKKILGIIKEELIDLKEKYGDERRTLIHEQEERSFEMEELIKEEDMVVTITHSGYIKRLPVGVYKTQRRGGKGVIAAGTKEEDFVEDLFVASTHSYLLFFTNKGQLHWLKVYDIPLGGRGARGRPVVNLIGLKEGEKVTAVVPVREFKEGNYLVMGTKKGVVKKSSLMDFSRPRRGGIRAINFDEGDELIGVVLTDGEKQIIMATRNGIAIRFKESDVRAMGRTAMGVRGIRLKGSDEVVGMCVAEDDKSLLTVTEKGFGKRSKVSDYRLINRGGRGVINLKITEKNGKVIAVKSVIDDDQLMFISKHGIAIRMKARDISVIGRATQGVRIMRLGEGDKVMAVAKIIAENGENGSEKNN